MPSGAFDLLDRPLVFIPVEWKGVGKGPGGEAVIIDHRVEVQVEMLDDDEFLEWSGLMSKDVDRGERNDLNERVAAAQRKLAEGEEGVAAVLTALQDAVDRLNERAAEAGNKASFDSFKRIAHDWRNIVANGAAVPFTDENIARLLRWPGFGNALGKAYLQTWRREQEIREGNSAGSPANGPAVEPTAGTTRAGTSPKRRRR